MHYAPVPIRGHHTATKNILLHMHSTALHYSVRCSVLFCLDIDQSAQDVLKTVSTSVVSQWIPVSHEDQDEAGHVFREAVL